MHRRGIVLDNQNLSESTGQERVRPYTKTGREWIWRALAIAFVDALIVAGAYFVALLARFDFSFSAIRVLYLGRYYKIIWIYKDPSKAFYTICTKDGKSFFVSLNPVASLDLYNNYVLPRSPEAFVGYGPEQLDKFKQYKK